MDSDHHYELAVIRKGSGCVVLRRICVGGIVHEDNLTAAAASDIVRLNVVADNQYYHFTVSVKGREYDFGAAMTKYLSSEVACTFTGAMIGLYAEKRGSDGKPAEFTNFVCQRRDDPKSDTR